MYFGVFYDTRAFLQEAHAAYPEKPILVTEYGIWSKGGGSSKQRQVDLFDALFPVFIQSTAWGADQQLNLDGFVCGITWWAMFDWYTAHTHEQTMGLYDMDRVWGKPIAESVEAAYTIWVSNQP